MASDTLLVAEDTEGDRPPQLAKPCELAELELRIAEILGGR